MDALRSKKAGLIAWQAPSFPTWKMPEATGWKWEEAWDGAQTTGRPRGRSLSGISGKPLGVRRSCTQIPLQLFAIFLKKKLAAALDRSTAGGMRNCGPDPSMPSEQDKRDVWA